VASLTGALLAAHVAAHIVLSASGGTEPFGLLPLLLLAANAVVFLLLLTGRGEPLLGGAVMFLVAAHAFVGDLVAPDALTSGAILLVNVLVVYVGTKVARHLPFRFLAAFVASYFVLYATFVLLLDNAEALFLLFLLLLCAAARSFRLLAYFWALVLAFTFFQPFAFETLLVSWFALSAVFGARGAARAGLAKVFLGAGLALLTLVFFPVVVSVLGENLLNVGNVLKDARVRAALALTFETAAISTGVLLAVTVPLAYGISRLRFPGRTVLLSVIDLPVVIPQSVAGIALISVLGRNQYLGEFVHGLIGVPVDNTRLGIVVAQVLVSLPFLAKAAIAAFDAVPAELEAVARTLRTSAFGAFRRVTLPLASRGILLGAVLAFARAAGEFGAIVILAPTPVTAPVEAYTRFLSAGAAETAPLVVTLLLFSFVMFFLLQTAIRLLPAGAAGEGDAR
jgi:molybdate/tungstate transport system permease protein